MTGKSVIIASLMGFLERNPSLMIYLCSLGIVVVMIYTSVYFSNKPADIFVLYISLCTICLIALWSFLRQLYLLEELLEERKSTRKD